MLKRNRGTAPNPTCGRQVNSCLEQGGEQFSLRLSARLTQPCNVAGPTAVAAYCQLAADWGMSGATLATRFVLSHQLVASAVVGATDEAQLAELADAARQAPLEPELAAAVDAIHQRYPNPTP